MPDAGALEPLIAELVGSARQEVLLIAPFIKEAAIHRLVADIASDVRLTVVTRWRLDEIVAGVSDLGVWPIVRDRGGQLLLLGNLHAKAYIADTEALIGSANLTSAALRGADLGNLEVLISTERANPAIVDLEAFITARATAANDEMYRVLAAAAAAVPIAVGDTVWAPRFRQPRDIPAAALGLHPFTEDETRLARHELSAIGLVTNSAYPIDRALISAALAQQPIVQALGAFVDVPEGRRFGEIRKWLADAGLYAEANPQTLIRWVLEFLPGEFTYYRPRHSEILRKGRS